MESGTVSILLVFSIIYAYPSIYSYERYFLEGPSRAHKRIHYIANFDAQLR